VAEACPECGSPYLLEKVTKEGTFLVCPNSRPPAKSKARGKSAAAKAAAAEKPAKAAKKSAKSAKAVEQIAASAASEPTIEPGTCTFQKKIAEPQPEPQPTVV
jgi:DNA topoisomerase-1